ncbi:DUF2238 domain-containing protein [Pontibacter sp. Tf4]|uniref:DUF2238 domain-containing protein n=1 Tax=Pontibacter sp. Tf4 TaxID=2761620 RepID=UPI00162AA7FB|nr:DUF2238 domain-containing protein [Pontibacter sp. Tf4]MBB6612734.1 DUF2238 domain-containing protein [Pontibacter sp. Tf4]
MPLTSRQPVSQKPFLQQPLHMAYLLLFTGYWCFSAFTTPDLLNWLSENILTASLLIFLVAFYNIFRFSDASYSFIFLFLLLHVYGSHYQYPDAPLGEWAKLQFNLQRNHYDRLVHFGFGLLLSYPMHEVLVRSFHVKGWLSYLLPVQFVLSLGALYELVEWAVADLLYNGTAQGMDFLGMQGDIWDAQKDIALGFAGSILTMGLALLQHSRK